MMNNRIGNNAIHNPARKVRLHLLGPAFIASIGYIDPGNFAINIQAGSHFGYQLLWVLVWANIMAMLIQLLSAKLGIATGKNLAEHIRDQFSRPAVWAYWIQAEIIAMATDLGEFIGAAIGFKILLGVSLLKGSIITGFATFFSLILYNYGKKKLEVLIGGLLLFVASTYIAELFYSRPVISKLITGMLWPTLPDSEAVFLAAGLLGATIMPHVIYLHSSLTQNSRIGNQLEQYSSTKMDIAIAMTIAGFINLAIMATAAAAFHFKGHLNIDDLNKAYLTLSPLLNHTAATIFGLGLIAAGLSSAVVGTLAGQVVMQGFVHFHIPLLVRRVITMLPSFFAISMGFHSTNVLVISQVLISFGIALALIPLLIFTSNRHLMDGFVNTLLMKILGWFIVAIVITLNVYSAISAVTRQ